MNPLRLLLPLLLALLPLGCSGGNFRVGVETHSTRFQAMPSPESILAGEPRACLVLPASGPDRHSPVVNVSLSMALRDRLPKVTAIPASHVASLANARGLYPTVNGMIAGHATAGLLDPAGLARLHEELKVEFVLLPTLVLVDRNEQTRLGFLGANLLFSSWTRVQVVLQLWRAEDGALVWQSVGGGSLDSETPSGIPASLQETLVQVFGVMLDDLLLGRSGALTSIELSERITSRSDGAAPAVETADGVPADATPASGPGTAGGDPVAPRGVR